MARILVIDDETEIRTLLRRVLERDGYEVTEASDGNVGARLYREKPTDLIITDIIMPEQEGIETIMELRRDFPDAKIIAVSGGGKSMTGTDCLRLAKALGARRTFPKPLNIGEFLESVRELVNE